MVEFTCMGCNGRLLTATPSPGMDEMKFRAAWNEVFRRGCELECSACVRTHRVTIWNDGEARLELIAAEQAEKTRS